jgi:hypothetical protein
MGLRLRETSLGCDSRISFVAFIEKHEDTTQGRDWDSPFAKAARVVEKTAKSTHF